MRKIPFAVVVVCLVGSVALPGVQPPKPAAEAKPAEHGIFPGVSIQWGTGPAALPPGAKVALLEGDPGKEGLFTLRLMLPAGYQIPPYWHPAVEHITVIAGRFNVGLGDAFDKSKGSVLPAGSFAFLAPKMNHFAWTERETIIQLHGVGPW